mgnify:CR=1 FL=1
MVFPHSRALADLVPGIWSDGRGRGYPSWIIGDWDELFREVDGAIRWHDDPTLVRLRDEMQAWVAREHTYVNRVRSLLHVIGFGPHPRNDFKMFDEMFQSVMLIDPAEHAAPVSPRAALIQAAEKLEAAAAELRIQAEKVA